MCRKTEMGEEDGKIKPQKEKREWGRKIIEEAREREGYGSKRLKLK